MTLSAATMQARAALAAPAVGAGRSAPSFLSQAGAEFSAMIDSVYHAIIGDDAPRQPVATKASAAAPPPAATVPVPVATAEPPPVATRQPVTALAKPLSPSTAAPAAAANVTRGIPIDTTPQGLAALRANSAIHSAPAVPLALPAGAIVNTPIVPVTPPSPTEFVDKMRQGLDKYNALMAERAKATVDTQQ